MRYPSRKGRFHAAMVSWPGVGATISALFVSLGTLGQSHATPGEPHPAYFFKTEDRCIMMMDFQGSWDALASQPFEERNTNIAVWMLTHIQEIDLTAECEDLNTIQLLGVRIPELDEYDRPAFGSRINLFSMTGSRSAMLDQALVAEPSLDDIKAELDVVEHE